LISLWRDGALNGVRSEEAFFVKCDRTTMTQDELARKASLWFLKSLSNLNQQLAERGIGNRPPSREEIIAAIDVLSGEILDAGKVQVVIDVLSPGREG
jgi:hypothetical protein